jgi:hypothetical protein
VTNTKTIGLLLCLFLAGATGGATRRQELRKAESFIHDFVEWNGLYYRAAAPNGGFYAERDHVVFGDCDATIHVSVTSETPGYTKESINMDVLFNLKDLDPKVAVSPKDLNGDTLPDNREWVILRTADGYRSMAIRRRTSIASPVAVFPLQGGATHEDTQKLADAFSKAITICRM